MVSIKIGIASSSKLKIEMVTIVAHILKRTSYFVCFVLHVYLSTSVHTFQPKDL